MRSFYLSVKNRFSNWGKTALLTAVIGTTFSQAAPLFAQHSQYNLKPEVASSEVPKVEQQRRLLFARLQKQPNDMNAAFAYAGLSSRLGDLEAAASTYEAMLLRAPNAARVRLELAATYFRLGAMGPARQNFERVGADPTTPAPVKARIAEYLAAIERHEKGRSGFSGQISMGLRHQDNANSAPDGETITWLGLKGSYAEQSDLSGFASAQINHRLPFGTHGHAIISGLSLGITDFQEVRSLRNQSAELRFGPEFSLSQMGLRHGKLAVTLNLGQSRLSGEPYLTSRGITLNLRAPMGRTGQITTVIDWRDEDFDQNAKRPRANQNDGQRLRLAVNYTRQISKDWQVFMGLRHDIRKAEMAMNAYRETGVSLGLNHRFASLIKGQKPWVFGLMGSLAHRDNDAPNRDYNSSAAQSGTEYMLQASQTIPLPNDFSVQIFGGLRGINSNYDIRDFKDHYFGLSLTKSF